MKFDILATTPRSITIEVMNQNEYFSTIAYDIYINGHMWKTDIKTNVYSLYGLEPDTDYDIRIGNHHMTVTTQNEIVRLNVRKFGAKGDGVNLDSGAIQAAIMACTKDGTVYLPEGIYYCLPIFLKSHMTIELDKGAVIKGHIDRKMYPIIPGYITRTDETDEVFIGTWEGNPLDMYASLITGIHVENVSIIGEGTVDGNAGESDWWVNPKIKRGAWRPRTIFISHSENVLLQGLTIQNSPSWTLHPYFSRKLKFLDLKVINHKDSPNTDGLDPESCSDVDIVGVNFSVGDDCIAIKSGKLYMGKKYKQPSERFNIRNCRMRHGHGAVVIGSEVAGGAKDIHVSQCLFESTDRGLRIKTRRGRGEDGVIDRITFSNIKMISVLTPFVMNMFYFCDPDGKTQYVWSKDKLPVDKWTPCLGKFSFKHIRCMDAEVAGAYFYGLPEQPIGEIVMEDVSVSFDEDATPGQAAMMSFADDLSYQGLVASNVNRLELKDVEFIGYKGERLILENIDTFEEKRG